MTAAFNEFMRQYTMTGSEKADGYSRTAFVGLDEHEKEEVFDLLKQELPYSAEWLFFIDQKKALQVAREKEANLRGNGYIDVSILQKELIKHSGDLSYQKHMIEDYPSYTDSLKARVVESVRNTPVSKVAIEFFKQVILTETNASAVTRAASALLAVLKVPNGNASERDYYDKLFYDLRSENIQDKLKAMKRLAKYEPSFS